MNIYVYEFDHPSGSRALWADWNENHARRFTIVRTLPATTRGDLEAIINNKDELPRAQALAERALKELMVSIKPHRPEPHIPLEPAPAAVAPRLDFWDRLKFLARFYR